MSHRSRDVWQYLRSNKPRLLLHDLTQSLASFANFFNKRFVALGKIFSPRSIEQLGKQPIPSGILLALAQVLRHQVICLANDKERSVELVEFALYVIRLRSVGLKPVFRYSVSTREMYD